MCPPGSLAKGSGALWASVKRQREEVCNPLWPMGHGQMSVWGHTRTFLFHKQVTHTHSFHTYINTDRHARTHTPRKATALSPVILICYSDGVFCCGHQVDRQSLRAKENRGLDVKGEENRQKEPLNCTPTPSSHQLPQPSLVDGTGSFISFLLIGHPGIDSGISSSPKHVQRPAAILHSP